MTAVSGLLRTIPLLEMLTPLQLMAVAGICQRCTFTAGEEVVVAGNQADAAYYLMDGQVECLTTGTDGAQIATAIPPGAGLLELGMIVELEVNATCIASGQAKVLKIPRKEMHDLMQEDIALTDKVIEALTIRLKEMADTMREASQPFEPQKRSA